MEVEKDVIQQKVLNISRRFVGGVCERVDWLERQKIAEESEELGVH